MIQSLPLPPQLAEDAPWKQRFRAERRIGRLAHFAPHRGLVMSNATGTFELYAWDVRTGAIEQRTERPAGTVFGSISSDGEWIVFLDDDHGTELGHYVRVPFEGGPAQDLTPSLPPYGGSGRELRSDCRLFAVTVPLGGEFFGYLVTLGGDAPGEPRLMYRSATLTGGPTFSRDASVVTWESAKEREAAFVARSFDVATGRLLAELEDEGGSVTLSEFSPISGDSRVLGASDRTGEKRPFVWDACTGERVDLRVDGLDGEVEATEWTPDAGQVLLVQTVRASQQLWLYHLDSGRLSRIDHPSGTYGTGAFLPEGDLAISWQDSTHPSQLIRLDTGSGEIKETLLESAQVAPGRSWRSITFASSGSDEIQGWLAMPEGDGPFPTILETHGGPTAATFNTFSPSSQMWLDHGYAFLTINYHGSTTFGRDFERSIWGNLGHWEVEDMNAAHRWLVDNGIARSDAVLLTGGSYGGYLTLHALGLSPELWAAGMAIVPVADWVSQYEDENEVLRGYDKALFGGTLDEMREQYVKSSPITYVDRLRAPVLIIHGRNDTRDPPRQVELYEAQARELGKRIQVEWFDTGHIGLFIDRELGVRNHALMLDFAYKALSHTR